MTYGFGVYLRYPQYLMPSLDKEAGTLKPEIIGALRMHL